MFAWRRATPLVMSPGYVRRHPRILSARLERADWDSSLTAHVDLVIPQPRSLSCRLTLDAMQNTAICAGPGVSTAAPAIHLPTCPTPAHA